MEKICEPPKQTHRFSQSNSGGKSALLCLFAFPTLTLIAICLVSNTAWAAQPADFRWWPIQQTAKAIVRTDFTLMKEVLEPKSHKPTVSLGQEHMLMESVAGLAAQAVNEGRSDELVWIASSSPDYLLWYESMTNRLQLADRGIFQPWELVNRFAKAGVIKGYILYSYDPSPGGATHLRPGSDESVNVATTLAGLLGGVIVSEGQEEDAKKLGLKKLFDARGKTEAWCFKTYRDQLNRGYVLVQDPQIPHVRDIAIAHRMLVMFGTNSPTPEVYAWLKPLSSVLGWNGAEEATSVIPISRAGHTLLPCNWSMNLCALSAGSENVEGGGKFQACDPRRIPFDDGKSAVSFTMSDGDNVQWMMGAFSTHKDYWASPDHGKFPIGWGAAIGCLDQCSPDTLAYLKRTQRPRSTLNLHAGGYFYPDLIGLDRTPEVRRQILTDHARRVSYYLKRSGCRTYQMLMMNLDTPAAHEAYEIFAREIEDLLGIFVIQYHPYEGGDGKVFWVNNGKGGTVPVVSAKFSIWGNRAAKKANSGTPAKVARVINESASAARATNSVMNAWCITHTWSAFQKINDNDEQAENAKGDPAAQRAVTPTLWCVERLDPSVKVVSPEELLWRMHMAHSPKQTQRLIKKWVPGLEPRISKRADRKNLN